MTTFTCNNPLEKYEEEAFNLIESCPPKAKKYLEHLMTENLELKKELKKQQHHNMQQQHQHAIHEYGFNLLKDTLRPKVKEIKKLKFVICRQSKEIKELKEKK